MKQSVNVRGTYNTQRILKVILENMSFYPVLSTEKAYMISFNLDSGL